MGKTPVQPMMINKSVTLHHKLALGDNPKEMLKGGGEVKAKKTPKKKKK